VGQGPLAEFLRLLPESGRAAKTRLRRAVHTRRHGDETRRGRALLTKYRAADQREKERCRADAAVQQAPARFTAKRVARRWHSTACRKIAVVAHPVGDFPIPFSLSLC